MPDHRRPERTTQRTRAQQRIDEADIRPVKLLADIEALRAELDDARRAGEEYVALLQRERAEFANYRRRTAEERERDAGLAGEDLIRKVLVIADDFDRAIDARPADIAEHAWVEGVTAIDRKLRLLLESEGVNEIDATPGRPFDPREHDAIANVRGTGLAPGVIVEEVRRGYRLRDRVIRPALVAVADDDGPITAANERNQPTTPESDMRND